MDVVVDDSALPANEVGGGSPAAVPELVHEQVRQYAEYLRDQLERKDVALQAELKRAQVSSAVIEKLRQELRKQGTAETEHAADPARYVQRISALETELHLKETELHNEIERVSLLSTSIRVLREELQKRGPARPAQFRVDSVLSHDSRGFNLYVLRS